MTSARLSFVGDVLIHTRLLQERTGVDEYSFTDNFKAISSYIRKADIASVNLESVTAGNSYGLSSYPKFNAPTELLGDLKETGFSVLSVANNHMLDMGEAGLIDSLKNIKAAGLAAVGASTSADSPDTGFVKEINGLKIGFVSFTDGAKIRKSLIKKSHVCHFDGETDAVRMIRRISPIKRILAPLRKVTDAIVLQLHFGEEYHRYPSSFQREFVTSLAELGADVIIGHHPHVLQPSEWIENSKGKQVLVVYSLGNFLSGQLGLYRQTGCVLSFGFKRNTSGVGSRIQVIDPEILLTFVDPDLDYQVRPLKEYATKGTLIQARGYGWVKGEKVYESAVAHARTYIPDLNVS